MDTLVWVTSEIDTLVSVATHNYYPPMVKICKYLTIYTQKKKFSQYLCFLIKSTVLHISLSNFIQELYYRNFICTCYCVTNNAFIRFYQPNFKMHDVHVLR